MKTLEQIYDENFGEFSYNKYWVFLNNNNDMEKPPIHVSDTNKSIKFYLKGYNNVMIINKVSLKVVFNRGNLKCRNFKGTKYMIVINNSGYCRVINKSNKLAIDSHIDFVGDLEENELP